MCFFSVVFWLCDGEFDLFLFLVTMVLSSGGLGCFWSWRVLLHHLFVEDCFCWLLVFACSWWGGVLGLVVWVRVASGGFWFSCDGRASLFFSSLLFCLWKLLFLDLVIETSWGIGWKFIRLILVFVWVLF